MIDYFSAASNNEEDAETPSMSPERLPCQAYNKGKIAEITTDEFSSEGLSITQCQLYCLTASSVFMGIVVRVDRNQGRVEPPKTRLTPSLSFWLFLSKLETILKD